jgi:hypothetical protein
VLQSVDRYKSWIDPNRFSSHNPISLEFDFNNRNLGSLFKIGVGWHKEEDFKSLVNNVWKYFDPNLGVTASGRFATSLKEVKDKVVYWDRERHSNIEKLLKEDEMDILEKFFGNEIGVFNDE